MVKRFISTNASKILSMTASELKQSIKASEGRVILSENVAFKESYIGSIGFSFEKYGYQKSLETWWLDKPYPIEANAYNK